MNYPNGKQLVELLKSAISDKEGFIIKLEGNPIMLCCYGNNYMVYIKCVTYAGSPYPKNTTRVQLPKRSVFDSLDNNTVFLLFGYDCVNDVYVCWEPSKTRQRLNKKEYVSFFCRKALQDNVKDNEVKEGFLSNGDKFVVFKRSNVVFFFREIDSFFPQAVSKKTDCNCEEWNVQVETNSKLDDVNENFAVCSLVDGLIANDIIDKLAIVAQCMEVFGTEYFQMNFKDWAIVVSKYIDEKYYGKKGITRGHF